MQKFHYHLFPIVFYILSLVPGTLHSQSAFVQLPDATGYAHNTPQHVLDSLQSASTALQSALPSAYQADFAVYDLGFYSHHTSMDGGIPQVISDAISDRITTPYYLLFGREMDREGRLKRVWVEVELPHTADFCFWEDGTLSHLKFMTETRANSVKGLSMSKQGAIFDAMIDGIKYMAGRVEQLVDCCSSSAREVCECGWSFEDIREFTAMRGFYELQADVVPSVSLDTVCVCFNEFQVNEEIHELDSGRVIQTATINEIKFSDSLSMTISELRSMLIEIGEAANGVGRSFFGAITDQSMFCASEMPPAALRSASDITYSEIEKEFNSSSLALWLNVLHVNGAATVSIVANGVSMSVVEKVFAQECLNSSEWHICAFNNIEFGYVPFLERPNGIVINGKNNSKITIKNGLIRHQFYLFHVDFGGQFEIDLSQVAIGYETHAGVASGVVYQQGAQLAHVRTLFLDGTYVGYWYHYMGWEMNWHLSSNAEAKAESGRNWFIAIYDDEANNTGENLYTPTGFGGDYKAYGSSSSIKKIILGINLNLRHIRSTPEDYWTAISLGMSGQSGPQQGFFKGGSLGVSFSLGGLDLITNPVPTNERSWSEIIKNWAINFFL